ncbi:MAG TPA: hypothetical protein DHW82_12815 [Spirochaetia bacterium]|nr:MAG: hypothetical protein A2Y41_03275 [Spirochaetes bacterium GWB1_36_13]HCL57871.1 hypothetical protein [Spirochaetia bacterium]
MRKKNKILLNALILFFSLSASSLWSYNWNIVDLYRQKMKQDFLVGSIWYHDGDNYKFEGRDNAVTHFFAEYQNDPAEKPLFQGGLIIPLLPNKVIEKSFSQYRVFLLHSKKAGFDNVAESMVGGMITIGNWEYYEQNEAAAVKGDALLEFSAGYIAPSYYSPLLFMSPVEKTSYQTKIVDNQEKKYYYEFNIPILHLSSFYKIDQLGKDTMGLAFRFAGTKGIFEYLEIMGEKRSEKIYNFSGELKGLFDWLSFEGKYNTEKKWVYGTAALEHLFFFQGDAKGETAYFSKKYAWAFGFKLFGGYYNPSNDLDIDYYFINKIDKPYTAGIDISVQMPFLIFMDSVLVAGGAALTVMTVATEIPIAIMYYIFAGEVYEFYLTQFMVAFEGALIMDIGNQYDRDVWKDNAIWCQFHIGAHYHDKEGIMRNPSQLDGPNKDEIFYYGKLDIFF